MGWRSCAQRERVALPARGWRFSSKIAAPFASTSVFETFVLLYPIVKTGKYVEMADKIPSVALLYGATIRGLIVFNRGIFDSSTGHRQHGDASKGLRLATANAVHGPAGSRTPEDERSTKFESHTFGRICAPHRCPLTRTQAANSIQWQRARTVAWRHRTAQTRA
jgi:hypothetical protein